MHRDQLHIAKPCHADWGAMSGDQRKRFCGSCTKHVHDLSSMTERQAERLVTKEAELCVRYTADADGRVIHARSRLPRLVAFGAALLGSAPAFASGAVVLPPPDAPSLVQRVMTRVQQAVDALAVPETVVSQGQVEVMGDIAPPPPPPPPKEILMGKIAAPPTIVIPPTPPPVVIPTPGSRTASSAIPTPAPGETVIPEVEEALGRQR